MAEQASPESKNKLLVSFLEGGAPLAAWLLFLGFGTAFLAFYYSKIGYLPILKWEESFSYLAGVSVLGGGAVVIYGMLLFFPGWIWSEFLIFDAELEWAALCNHLPDGTHPEPCFLSICRYILLPFALLMSVLHLVLYAGADPALSGFTVAVGLLSVIWYSLLSFLRMLEGRRVLRTTAEKRSLLVKYSISVGVATLVSVVSLFILSWMVNPGFYSGTLLVICTTWVVVSNFLVAVQYRQKAGRAWVTSILAALSLMVFGEVYSCRGESLSERLMKGFGIGDPQREVSLNLVSDGSRPDMPHGGLFFARDGQRAHPALPPSRLVLLSRLGAEYLVEWIEKEPEQTGGVRHRMAVPKEQVASWSSIEPEPLPPRSFNFQKLTLERMIVYQLCWALTGGCLAILIGSIVKKLPVLKRIFRREQAGSPSYLLHLKCDGTVITGAKKDVVAAAEAGKRLRVGWKLGSPEGALIHWAEPTFLKIAHGNVYAQVPAFPLQMCYPATILFGLYCRTPEQWYGEISTDGRLSGGPDPAAMTESFAVEQMWCLA